jgi:hypothetical protein
MKTFKGLWIMLAIVLCSSVAFGNVSIPSTFAPQQAVVDTVILVIDGAPAAKRKVAAASPAIESRTTGPAERSSPPAAATDAETARLAQYVALHKGQATPW